MENRRSGEERRSNFRDALSRLNSYSSMLYELDSLLQRMYKEHSRKCSYSKTLDTAEGYWGDELAAIIKKYRK